MNLLSDDPLINVSSWLVCASVEGHSTKNNTVHSNTQIAIYLRKLDLPQGISFFLRSVSRDCEVTFRQNFLQIELIELHIYVVLPSIVHALGYPSYRRRLLSILELDFATFADLCKVEAGGFIRYRLLGLLPLLWLTFQCDG